MTASEAKRGRGMKTEAIDLQKMNTGRNLFRMSIPIFIELLLQLLVGNIDQIMVSQYSQGSVAAIVNANQVMNLIIIVLNMTSMGTTVVLSQYLGAKDELNASRTCSISLFLSSILGVIVTAFILLAQRSIFPLLHVPAEIVEETYIYLTIVASFTLVQGLYLNFAAILRTYTFMKEVMYVSVVMNVLNIIGNVVLINGYLGMPRLGVAGAAISTVASKTIGMILIIYLFRKKVNLPIGMSYLKPFSMKIFGQLCKLAFPSGLESFSYQFSQVCILSIVNIFGTMITATKGYCSILSNFSYIYAIAMGSATQIVVGYLLGAKQPDEIEKRTWNTLKISIVVCEVMTGVLFLSCNWLMRIFTSDPAAIALARNIFMIEFLLEFGRACNITMTRCLIAVGDIKTPIIVGIGGHWLIAWLFSYIFGIVCGWGLEGVWLAMALDETIRGIIYIFRFRQRKWRKAVTEQG